MPSTILPIELLLRIEQLSRDDDSHCRPKWRVTAWRRSSGQLHWMTARADRLPQAMFRPLRSPAVRELVAAPRSARTRRQRSTQG